MAQNGEYEKLEYISNPNGGYIDTGFIPNQDTRVVAKIKTQPKEVNDQFCFGSSGSSWLGQSFEFWVQGNHSTSQMMYGAKYAYGSKMKTSTIYVLDFNKNVWNNGIDLITFQYKSFSCPHNLYIWYCKRDNNIPTPAVFYSLDIYDNDVLVRNFIPVRRRSDGKIGMLDKVENTFYLSPNSAGFTGE